MNYRVTHERLANSNVQNGMCLFGSAPKKTLLYITKYLSVIDKYKI